jgi:hypothetical protein
LELLDAGKYESEEIKLPRCPSLISLGRRQKRQIPEGQRMLPQPALNPAFKQLICCEEIDQHTNRELFWESK